MIILGIDPGTTSVGYAVLNCSTGREPILFTAGLITIGRSRAPHDRLQDLHHNLVTIVSEWKPERAAVERLFFAKNTKTALAVSEARGAILLTLALAGLTVYEYTPLEAKMAITSYGRADKKQMQKMLHVTLPESKKLRLQDDTFDAIALALACFYKERYNTIKET